MITISEKDGATIIVVESPISKSEEDLIKKAKNIQQFKDVWSKFACNKGKEKAKSKPAKTEPATAKEFNLDDFEVILDDADVPF